VPSYVVDASLWSGLWKNHPPGIFVHLWQPLDASTAAGDAISPEDVLRELEQDSHDLPERIARRLGLLGFFDEALMRASSDVLVTFPDFLDENAVRNPAGPVAVAPGNTRT